MPIIIQTLNDSAVLDALQTLIATWQPLMDNGVTVEQGEPPNESPEKCPWVGLYRSHTSLIPRAIGLGSGFRVQRMTVAMMLTESSDSGDDCARRLSKLVQGVASALCSDQSIGGTVDTAAEMDIVYSNYAQSGAAFFQTAVVTVTLLAPVQATNIP